MAIRYAMMRRRKHGTYRTTSQSCRVRFGPDRCNDGCLSFESVSMRTKKQVSLAMDEGGRANRGRRSRSRSTSEGRPRRNDVVTMARRTSMSSVHGLLVPTSSTHAARSAERSPTSSDVRQTAMAAAAHKRSRATAPRTSEMSIRRRREPLFRIGGLLRPTPIRFRSS